MPDFPDYCIRGIKKKSHFHEDTDTASSALYMPDTRTPETRADRGSETSINWEDDDNALNFTLQFLDEDNPTLLAFQYGAVKLPRNALDEVNNLPSTMNTITYERHQLRLENPYHGNIVYKAGLAQHAITMIANVLAASSSKVHRKNASK
ncbi:MAG: hypothetical protein WBW94_10965 [Anaerolineales bacterium]